MLTKLPQKFSIDPIVNQVNNLSFGKRLDLNRPTGKFFNDPWEVLPEFKDTPIGEVLKSIGNIGQARLLKLESAESYTAHADPDDRIHLAIITNSFSFLVDIDDNKLYHLPADGQLWYMDTGKLHVATNWGGKARTHLNIRILLPKFDRSKKGLYFKVLGNAVDWKQVSYMPVMQLVNKEIKAGRITGFEAPSERELFINTEFPETFDLAIRSILTQGVEVTSEIL
jgi:hypothetical protein